MVNTKKKKNFFFDFTIITIVKNDEKNIENTIKSVLSQKYVKVQYIVLDGYSSDKTFEKLKKYKNFIKIIRFKDKSFYHGLNHALKFATGRFVGILNSGDIYYNQYVLNKVNKKNLIMIFYLVIYYILIKTLIL